MNHSNRTKRLTCARSRTWSCTWCWWKFLLGDVFLPYPSSKLAQIIGWLLSWLPSLLTSSMTSRFSSAQFFAPSCISGFSMFVVSLEESWTHGSPARTTSTLKTLPAIGGERLEPSKPATSSRFCSKSIRSRKYRLFQRNQGALCSSMMYLWILRNGVTPNDLNDIALSNRTLVRSSCNWQSLTNGYPHATVNQPTSKGSADLLRLPRTKDLANVEKYSMPIPQGQFTRAKTNRTTFLDRNSSCLNKNKGHTTNRQCSRVAMPFPGRKWVCGFLVGSLSCYQIFKTIGDLLTDSDSNAEFFPMFFLVPIKQGRETPCLSGGNRCSGSPQDPAVPCRKESHTQKGQKGIGANSSKRCNIWIKMSTMYTYRSIMYIYIYMPSLCHKNYWMILCIVQACIIQRHLTSVCRTACDLQQTNGKHKVPFTAFNFHSQNTPMWWHVYVSPSTAPPLWFQFPATHP